MFENVDGQTDGRQSELKMVVILKAHSNYFMAEQTHFNSLLQLMLGDPKGVHNRRNSLEAFIV